MALGSIAQSRRAAETSTDQLSRNRGAVTVRLGNAPYQGTLVTDCVAGKAGTPVKLRQGNDVWGVSLADALTGRKDGGKAIQPSIPGDVIVFEAGYLDRDELVVGRIAGRTHDGIQGHAQVMKVLARASYTSVSKRGITQYACLADPASAKAVRTHDDVAALVVEHKLRAFPGGEVSFLLRCRDRQEEFRFDPGEKPDAFVRRLVETNAIIAKGPVELMPLFHMQMGREQSLREGLDPRVETAGKSMGRLSKLYSTGRGAGFLPSIAIICDEDEWAFGGKTGKRSRVAACLDPLEIGSPVSTFKIPSAFMRDQRGALMTPYQSRELWRPEELEAMAADRKTRFTPEPQAVKAKPAYLQDGPPPRRAPPPRMPTPGMR